MRACRPGASSPSRYSDMWSGAHAWSRRNRTRYKSLIGRMTSATRKEVRTRVGAGAASAGDPSAAALPPGPRAPALWQTLAWMSRPGAFLQGVHRRFGDPATIRTYWTEEPMVLFSGPDAVREVFALPAAIAPA